MSLMEFAEFVSMFWMPLLVGAFAVAGVVMGLAFRTDSPEGGQR